MPIVRSRVALALAVAVLTAGVAFAIPSACAQEPPANQGAGQGKANAKAGAARKKPARRRPWGNAVGVIVPYPLGGSLIIRHTPETHDEIQALLNMLRYH